MSNIVYSFELGRSVFSTNSKTRSAVPLLILVCLRDLKAGEVLLTMKIDIPHQHVHSNALRAQSTCPSPFQSLVHFSLKLFIVSSILSLK